MPRAKKTAPSVQSALVAVSASLNQLMHAIAASVPVGATGGKALALPKMAAAAAKQAENPTYSKAQKGVWAKYTPAQREARIRKMLAARGVKRKGSKKK